MSRSKTQTVNREDFLHLLEMVEPGLSAREIIEQSSCFIFKEGMVWSFNDEVACQHKTELEIEGAVQAAPLLAILRKLTEERIEIGIKESQLCIEGKRKETRIRMEEEVHLPTDAIEKPKTWKPLAEDFLEGLGLVQHCAGKDESKYWTTCVHIHPKWLEASDHFQLTRFRTRTGVERSRLVRRDSLVHILKLDVTEFSETPCWIHFRNKKGLILSCRAEVDDYPNLKPWLEGEGEPTSLPKGLVEAVEKAEIFSAENVNENQVLVQLWPGKPGKLKIKGEGVFGWYSEFKTLKKYTGQAMKFRIAPKLLTEITQRHADCTISPKKLKVKGEKFTYVTSLSLVKEK
jgi:DNA polymerase III sliding clamp (beta) subunit (PCNA family)